MAFLPVHASLLETGKIGERLCWKMEILLQASKIDYSPVMML